MPIFSLKMHIRSVKTYAFVCLYALLSCLHTHMLLSDIKCAHCQNIRKENSISNIQKMA